jgi:hypothetical protein
MLWWAKTYAVLLVIEIEKKKNKGKEFGSNTFS